MTDLMHPNNVANALDVVREELTIETTDDYKAAPAFLAELKASAAKYDAEFKEEIAPLKALTDQIGTKYKPSLKFAKEAEALIKERLNEFVERENELQRQLIEQVPLTVDPKERALLVAGAAAHAIPEVPGLSYREGWEIEITDAEGAVDFLAQHGMLHYLQPDEKALKAAAKLHEGELGIPGVVARRKNVVTITKAAVK